MATGTPSPKLKAKAIPARPSKGLIDDHSKDSEEGDWIKVKAQSNPTNSMMDSAIVLKPSFVISWISNYFPPILLISSPDNLNVESQTKVINKT